MILTNNSFIGKFDIKFYNLHMSKNVYIHIPFCKQKCNYCSFISFPRLDMKDQYIKALIKEIKTKYRQEQLRTLYFGGGTPSLLDIEDFKAVISLFNTNSQTEITCEANPETLSQNYLEKLKGCGINRLSIGCQTFDDNILKIIGRHHTANQVKQVVNYAQNAGFKNISLDFIYGLPNQNIKGFETDLKTACELGIQHISLYGLKIDDNCYFYKNPPEFLPDDDTQAEMYLKANEILTQQGYLHYEISNFAKKGYESKHNLNYWNNNSYYGFGLAAHGYLDNIRYSNKNTLEEYIKNPLLPQEKKVLTHKEQLEEEIFLGFRRNSGINVTDINKKYKIDFNNKYKDIINKYINSKHLEKTANGYRLTNEGILVSNYILADFI